MDNKLISHKSLWISALILSLGLIVASAVLGYAFKTLNRNSNSITVKGLAEKAIQADAARWEIHLRTSYASDSKREAYQLLDQQMKVLQRYFVQHGFKDTDIKLGNKNSNTYYEETENAEGRLIREFKGYTAEQTLTVNTREIRKIAQAAKNMYQLDENGISVKDTPEYLVSNLEEIKMSLIANATQNAHNRANEFAKVGHVKVGAMKSASQGAFYILPESGSDEDSDYGGAYDKQTINKIARVVVTINYAIE